jgi:predicted nucleotidyltransferase
MGLIEFLKREKNARKIFGKREIKIIEKQLVGLKLTQSERNRLSRDIRAKLDFIKKAADYGGEFKLKHAAKIKEIIQNATEAISKDSFFSRIKRIILFGSYAEKQVHLDSDIDIAADFDDISLKEATDFRIRISGKVSDKADIQVYNFLPDKIKKEIDKNGVNLYKR